MTSIEWTHRPGTKGESWNPIRARDLKTGAIGWHCAHASDGCRNCYAERLNLNRRGLAFGTGLPYKPGHEAGLEIFVDEKTLAQPLRWRQPRTIFVCSMTDLFGAFVPDTMIDRVFAVAALCPQHTFIVLTKRSARMREYLNGDWSLRIIDKVSGAAAGWLSTGRNVLPNVWLGVSAERQQEADERIPDLLATPAAIRFTSLEPLLGAIDLVSVAGGTQWIGGQRGHDGRHRHSGRVGEMIHGRLHTTDPQQLHHHHDERCERGLDWVIVGGESGPDARPMHPDWARSLRDQCAAAGVPFFFKQWGSWASVYDRQAEDPDWRRCDIVARKTPNGQWLNFAGGQGFHGERVVRVDRLTKKAAGRLLDGVEHNGWPA